MSRKDVLLKRTNIKKKKKKKKIEQKSVSKFYSKNVGKSDKNPQEFSDSCLLQLVDVFLCNREGVGGRERERERENKKQVLFTLSTMCSNVECK